ncbi:hypothetical protein [Marinoscillum sp.]|uniref:hypothetical protein n=1 Tax=Marinoscillum sp. TaxID=2024838 RepID=UPI003BAB205D
MDIKEYLTLVNGDAIYPNEQQLALLREVVPKEPYQPAPAYTHRTYWEDFGQTDLGKYYLEDAEALIERDPEVPISDEIFGEPQSHHKIKY